MLIVEIKNGDNIEKALKVLKSKVIKTKQNQILFEKKEFKKKSVSNREKILKAIYTESKRRS
jgi:small subunit ribosomal protein S21